MSRQPVIFLSHGAPPLIDDTLWTSELTAWGQTLKRPEAILMISAHWEAAPASVSATRPLPLVYDFYNFPARYYTLQYPAPGAPVLAAKVRARLAAAGLPTTDDPSRGLDHGAYIPLMYLFPKADVPVLQLSMPTLSAAPLYKLGEALTPLRDEGVLIIGSGFMTHNLRLGFGATAPSWAREFDQFAAEALQRGDDDTLIELMAKAPGAALAHPRVEHLAPLWLAAGAARGDPAPKTPVKGFWMGGFSKRSVQWG
ncbi:dioxygenase [Myxococcota bacterium]|nr:dioxygenase [Myxococcota bacterium]